MSDPKKMKVLGVGVNVTDYSDSVDRILLAAAEGRPFTVSAMAVHGLMTGVLDRQHRFRLNHFDFIVPDGQPVRWALNALYDAGLKDRVYGPRLTLELCREAAARSLPVYFYGSTPAVLHKLVSNLEAMFPGLPIAGAEPSLFRLSTENEKHEIAERIRTSGAKLVFVGLGCPRQEIWAYEYRELLPMPLVAVGAAFDFHAGTLAQAPRHLQDWGLEWAFRLCKEPKRLWKRYLTLNPLFLLLFAAQWLTGTTFFKDEGTPPLKECRYA